MNTEMEIWQRFVDAGGLDLAKRKLQVLVGKTDKDVLYWAFKRALTYTEPISFQVLADAVAKRAASAIKRKEKEDLGFARDLCGGVCLGALA